MAKSIDQAASLFFLWEDSDMPVSVTPTLSVNAGYLSDVRDQVMALMRFIVMNPGNTSSIWEEKLISFRKIAAEYEGDRNALISVLSSKINTLFKSKFTDCDITTSLKAEDVDTVQYRVVFDITMTRIEKDVTQEIPLIVSGQFLVNTETYDITIKWTRSSDTATMNL